MPPLTNINQINATYISNLINVLLQKKLYRSEAQLQFDIAWELKKDLLNLRDWEILLEYVTATTSCGTKTQKFYTDIVVYNTNSHEFIPIELKYKTKRYPSTGIEILKHHGAQDLGCYDFWWDTKRCEILQSCSCSLTSHSGKTTSYIRESYLKHYISGFSIFVTNDNSYLTSHNKSCAKFLFPLHKTPPHYVKNLDWDRTNPSIFYKGTWRDMPIMFNKNYPCIWQTITNTSTLPTETFNFMIIEI